MENSSFSCRFSLYPMDSDFVSIILGALDATDTGAVTSASDAMSTIYTGPQNSVLDGVEGLFGNAFRPGVHMALEGQFAWKDQPGAETGAAPNRAANPDRHFPMLCKVTVYPVERMADAVELARQTELQPAQAADTLRLQGDVQQVFGYLDQLCSLLRQQNAAGAHFTISVNSPTAE